MKIYADSELTQEVTDLMDLGIVEAGETKQFTFWVMNDSLAVLQDLEFDIDHSEASIVEAPRELDPRSVGTILIEWSPSITLKQGLKTQIKITARELWA